MHGVPLFDVLMVSEELYFDTEDDYIFKKTLRYSKCIVLSNQIVFVAIFIFLEKHPSMLTSCEIMAKM